MQGMKSTTKTFINGRTLKSYILKGSSFFENRRFVNVVFDEEDDLSSSSFLNCYFEDCTFSFKNQFSRLKLNSSVLLHCTFHSMFARLFTSKVVFSDCSFLNANFDGCEFEKTYIYDSAFCNFFINGSRLRNCTLFGNKFTFFDRNLDVEKINTLLNISIDYETLLTFMFETNIVIKPSDCNNFKVIVANKKSSHIVKNMIEFNEILKKSEKKDEYWFT